jgi:hypothetical protein
VREMGAQNEHGRREDSAEAAESSSESVSNIHGAREQEAFAYRGKCMAEISGARGKSDIKNKGNKKERGKSYSTQYSHLVSYDSTDWASTWLSSQIGRDTERSGVYGRSYQVLTFRTR